MVCRLLPGLLGVAVQGLLFIGVCVALLWKKAFDDPPRAWVVFLADSSKQVAGAGWLHVLNVASSWGLDAHVGVGDACDWYFINIMTDCTVGVAIEFVLMQACGRAINWLGTPEASAALETGSYYEPIGYGEQVRFQYQRYSKQLALWLVIVTLMKGFIVLLLLVAQDPLLRASRFILGAIPSSEAKLLVVMVGVPYVMNVVQVCLVDMFIKQSHTAPPPHPLDGHSARQK